MNFLRYAAALALFAGTVQGQGEVPQQEKPKIKIPLNNRIVDDMALAPDGKTIAVAGGTRRIATYDINTGKLVREYEDIGGNSCVAFSADGKLLAGGAGHIVKIWDVETGKEKFSFPGNLVGDPIRLAFTPSGKKLIVHGYLRGIEGSRITQWELSTKKLTTFPVKTSVDIGVISFTLSSDGQTLYYDLGRKNSEQSTLFARDLRTGDEKSISSLSPGTGSFRPAVSPDGKTILFGKQVLNVAKGTVSKNEGFDYRVVSFSPDGKIIVANNSPGMRVFDPSTWKEILNCRAPGTAAGPLKVCPVFTPDSQNVIVPGYNELWVWDISDFMKKRGAK